MDEAVALGERGRGNTAPNPNVGCVIVKDGIVVGRGWTRPGGRPHAEAVALSEAGEAARGAIAYVRFASVYRNFREAKDFQAALDELSGEDEPKPAGARK